MFEVYLHCSCRLLSNVRQDLMEALLLLESCLDPKWLKPWYRPAQQKMQSTLQLLRLSTPAAVALRLFALDRAILYDKVRTSLYVCGRR